ICKKLHSHEIYGRYIDDIFFTWNDTKENLEKLLEKLNNHHPNIKLEYKIGQTLPFLDVLLTNNNGTLSTSVYRKPAAEPYVVPFTSDHPHHIFRNIIRTALLRAIRYSSTFVAFNVERRNIRLMLLYNGYPSTYINKEFHAFFNQFHQYDSYSSILPMITDENQFNAIHNIIAPTTTHKQSQTASDIALSQVGIPLRPIIAGIHAPATLTSKFLNDLLAPIYLIKVARETTFIHSIDVIKQLETYVDNGYFKSTTRFITADVKNLYTMIPRQGALETLIQFLLKHSNNRKIGTLYIDTILRMARLILDTNCFAYKNNYYQQNHGGAMGSAFTQVLANIYMLEWEQDLIQHQLNHKEIYGRYIDDIFMTTNQSLDDIQIVLEKAKHKDVNIEIECTIASTVNYLDVTITNEEGQLKTTVYHKPTAEPYYLPYRSDHPHKYHRNIPYSALTRAARLCSNVYDFNLERLRIEMSLLLGQYPLKLITNEFLRFFQLNKAMPVFEQHNQQAYQDLHQQLLNRRARKDTTSNNPMKDPVKYPEILHKNPWDRKKMYLRYPFENGPMATFPKEFTSWWKKHYLFQGSHLQHIKLHLIPKTNSTLARSLIHKKPPRTMLRLSEEPNN
ncbi:unnamed protein product, partial [Adineta steineri]